MIGSRRTLAIALLAFGSIGLGGIRVGSAQGSGLNAPPVLTAKHWQQIGSGLVAPEAAAVGDGVLEQPGALLIQDPWREVRSRPHPQAEPARSPTREMWRMQETIDPWAPAAAKSAAAPARVALIATREIVNPWPARPRGTWATRREIIDPWAAPPR